MQYILQVCNYGHATEFKDNHDLYLSDSDKLDSIKSRFMFHTRLTDSSVIDNLDYSNSAISLTENSNTTGNYDLSHLQSFFIEYV